MHQVLATSSHGITYSWADVILLHRSKTRPACTCIALQINSDQTVYRHTRNMTHSSTDHTVYRRAWIAMQSKSDQILYQLTRNVMYSNTDQTVYRRAWIIKHSKSDKILYQLTRNVTHSNTDQTEYRYTQNVIPSKSDQQLYGSKENVLHSNFDQINKGAQKFKCNITPITHRIKQELQLTGIWLNIAEQNTSTHATSIFCNVNSYGWYLDFLYPRSFTCSVPYFVPNLTALHRAATFLNVLFFYTNPSSCFILFCTKHKKSHLLQTKKLFYTTFKWTGLAVQWLHCGLDNPEFE